MYRPTTIAKADFNNSVRLTDLVKDGKIYLSLSDAIALALENNYDIAIEPLLPGHCRYGFAAREGRFVTARRRRDSTQNTIGRHIARP